MRHFTFHVSRFTFHFYRDLLAVVSLLALTLAFFWKIAFTNLILVGLDVFTYFYPYKAYAAEIVRQGRLPLWNPYLFMGVPFLANAQTALFYPLNLPLYWLSVPRMVSYSIVLHVFLAGLFAYFYARRSLGLGRWGAWLAASVFALSGFVGAQVEHVNQLNCSIWLPLLFLLFDLARGNPLGWLTSNPPSLPRRGRGRVDPHKPTRFSVNSTRSGLQTSTPPPTLLQGGGSKQSGWLYVLLAGLVVGLQFAAGHTQSSYITLFALGVYAIFPPLWRRWGKRRLSRLAAQRRAVSKPSGSSEQARSLGFDDSVEKCISGGSPQLVEGALSSANWQPGGGNPNKFGTPALPGGDVSHNTTFFNRIFDTPAATQPALALLPDRERPKREIWHSLLTYLLIVIIGVVLAAVQLLPTLELSQLSVRGGGLSYREAASFSLTPRLLLLSLLPTFGGEEVFSEYVAYLGIVALTLALVGALFQRRNPARPLLIFLTALGLFLGLGAYNPFYFVLYKLVPGFDLFRAPARWLYLYTFGGAMLAGLGADFLSYPLLAKAKAIGCGVEELSRFIRRHLLIAIGVLAVPLVLLSPFLDFPTRSTLLAWLPLALVALIVLWVGLTGNWKLEVGNWKVFQPLTSREQRAKEQGVPPETPKLETRNSFCLVLTLAVIGELFAASRSLAYNHPTAPEAYSSLRTAPAHLLAAGQPTDRFLSISDLTFDPGDLGEIQQIFEAQLSPQAIYDYVVATKLKEILAPNLPLVYRIPSVDGYDGGVLPLRRYVELQRLFLPEPSPDGRLRESLKEIPPSRILSLLNVRYVVTDKIRDVWMDGVYYDLSHEAVLGPGVASQVEVTELPAESSAFAATSLGLVSYLEGAADLPNGAPVAQVTVTDGTDAVQSRLLRAGIETAEGEYAMIEVRHDQARVCRHWPDNPQGDDYLARLDFGEPMPPRQILIEYLAPVGRLHLRGLSLIDDRTSTFVPVVVSTAGRFRLVHSGDVKIYENLDNLSRAFVVHRARILDDEAAIAAMQAPAFRPEQEVILASDGHEVPSPPFIPPKVGGERGGARKDEVAILSYEPERVVISAKLAEEGYLVLTDAHYPGWRALTDGLETPIYRADLLFRAVYLPAGQHRVEFIYDPLSFRLGAAISLTALLGLTAGIAALAGRRRKDGV